jgi:hypothetical protein
MAKKANALTFAQEPHGQAAVTNRQPEAETAAFYLLQVRPSKLKISPLKKRVPVVVDDETRAAVPRPVKIIHVD